MTPVVMPSEINIRLDVVIPPVLAAVAVILAGLLLRTFLVAVADAFVDLWRTYAPVASAKVLGRRPGLDPSSWICAGCSSYNGVATTRCYRCGSHREASEAPDPEAP